MNFHEIFQNTHSMDSLDNFTLKYEIELPMLLHNNYSIMLPNLDKRVDGVQKNPILV